MACPFGGAAAAAASAGAAAATARCPLGYDSSTFKLGPLSCVICRALLFKAVRCQPCRHIFCRTCISRFKDCPLCGADITGLEDDLELQRMVDQFIQGHARIQRQEQEGKEEGGDRVAYEDASLARGTFLLQHAMRAFQAQNLESAKDRLDLCLEDIRQVMATDSRNQVQSQFGAILGLLGDCLRSMGDLHGAIVRYSESVEALEKIENKDAEIIHALAVSLNKLGDVKYYAEDIESAHALYKRALELRQDALADNRVLSTEAVDVAVSLAKVADVKRALGHESAANRGFTQAINMLEELSVLDTTVQQLENRRSSVLEFLYRQQASS